MKPKSLCDASHNEKSSRFQEQGDGGAVVFVSESKLSRRSEAEGCNGPMWLKRLFVIAVPGHALCSIEIIIE